MIQIDGSQGEGGGQILRTSLALSIATGKPVRLRSVRAGRRNPGLAPQHLAGVKAAAQICDGTVEGAKLGSMDITFRPGDHVHTGRHVFDISRLAETGSAGAATLLLQNLLLPLALADGGSHLTLRGGTHVAWSPPAHYVQWVLFPTLARIGLRAEIEVKTWGWYPKGGGEISVTIHDDTDLTGIDLTARGSLETVLGIAAVSNLPSHIPQRMTMRANSLLQDADLPGNITPLRTSGPSTGAGIFMAVESENATAGFSGLGEKGKPSEQVAEEAIEPLLAYTRQNAALDPYLPDQIIPMLMLAEGPSALTTMEITQHTLTNIAIVQAFVDRKVVVEGAEGEPGMVRVEGEKPRYR